MTTSLTSGDGSGGTAATPCFYSVPEAARMIGMAPVTLYRAIREGEFPAMPFAAD
jgi:predicted DNA-binding transcriptional regulator AlpA